MASTTGKYWRARYSSTTVIHGAVEATVESANDELDATDAQSDGFTNTDSGCADATITINGNYLIDQTIFPTLGNGAVLTNVRIYLQSPSGTSLTGPYWSFPSAEVLSCSTKKAVRGKVEYTMKLKNKGAYTFVTS